MNVPLSSPLVEDNRGGKKFKTSHFQPMDLKSITSLEEDIPKKILNLQKPSTMLPHIKEEEDRDQRLAIEALQQLPDQRGNSKVFSPQFSSKTDSLVDMVRIIQNKMESSGLGPNFLAFLQDILWLPIHTEEGSKNFLMICQMLRHMTVSQSNLPRSKKLETLSASVQDFSVSYSPPSSSHSLSPSSTSSASSPLPVNGSQKIISPS